MSIEIILAHANWCPHCHHFAPIYDSAQKIAKNDNYLNKYNVIFKSFDIANDSEKEKMDKEYDDEVKNIIQGYPTVILIYNINNKKGVKTIETTVINNENLDTKSETMLVEDAANEFVNNIKNRIKTELSDNKDLYIQGGGGKNYKNKKNIDYYDYINYKIKYIELQKNI